MKIILLLMYLFLFFSCKEKNRNNREIAQFENNIIRKYLVGVWDLYKYNGLLKTMSIRITEDSLTYIYYQDQGTDSSSYKYNLNRVELECYNSNYASIGSDYDTLRFEIFKLTKDSLQLKWLNENLYYDYVRAPSTHYDKLQQKDSNVGTVQK